MTPLNAAVRSALRQYSSRLRMALSSLSEAIFHGLKKCHLQRYLDEFVFRWYRRLHMRCRKSHWTLSCNRAPERHWIYRGRQGDPSHI